MVNANVLIPLLLNAAMLLAMVEIYSIAVRQFGRRMGMMPDRSRSLQAFTGLMMGLICIGTILTPVQYAGGNPLDTRSVLLSVTGLFFGGLATAVAVLLTLFFRLWQGGPVALAGTVIIVSMGLCGLAWRRFRRPDLKKIGLAELYLFGVVTHVIMMGLMLALPPYTPLETFLATSLQVLLVFPLATVTVGKLLADSLRGQQLAHELRENDQRLRMALSASEQDLFELNLQTGEMTSITEEEKARRYPRQRYHRNFRTLLEDIHADDKDKVAGAVRDLAAGRITQWQGEFRQATLDGDWEWIFIACRLVENDAEGRPRLILGTYMLITPRKKVEENLRVFRELIDNTTDAFEIVDPLTGRFLDVNSAGCEALGYTREEFLELTVFDLDPMLDRDVYRKSIERLQHGETTSWQGMHKRKDGSVFPVEVNRRYVSLGRDYIVSVVRDVTERHKIDDALRMASLVYQNSHEAMIVFDRERRIIDVNPTFTTITGYAKEEVLGRDPYFMRSDRQPKEFYDAMWMDMAEKGHWSGEMWQKRKNGEVFPQRLEVNAVRDADGKVYRWVAQFSDISQMKHAEIRIWQQANFDGLTRLPNRSMFQDRLNQEIKRAHRSHNKLALLFLDLDLFKEVNDSLGHDMGDLLLQQVADRLRESVRESDTIARLGGDEFTITLNDLHDTAVVGSIAQKILDRLAAPFTLKASTVYVSASLGITFYPDDGATLEVLLKNADQAMYAAKREGRNRYFYFTPAMQEQVNRRSRMIAEMRQGISDNQFRVVYQPVVALRDGKVCKAEALVRWQHPVEGMISPAQFIPIAEESGLITPLGNLVFRDAAQMARRMAAWFPGFRISVNRSPAQFDSKEQDWVSYLRESGLLGTTLVVEITEGLLLDARPAVQQQLQQLQEAGMEVALDDFGTGYSSLAYLKKFDISYIKIDKSFIQNLAPGNQDLALCEAMITMAHRLGLEVIAEGVETEEQRELLIMAGCDFGQGYLFSPPIVADALEDILKQQAGIAAEQDAPLNALN